MGTGGIGVLCTIFRQALKVKKSFSSVSSNPAFLTHLPYSGSALRRTCVTFPTENRFPTHASVARKIRKYMWKLKILQKPHLQSKKNR